MNKRIINLKSVSGPQWSQLMCLLQSANCQFANLLNLEKCLLSIIMTHWSTTCKFLGDSGPQFFVLSKILTE